ncbi:purine-nucleoside phosphorylase, partial [Candidatus Uhrbacteria bacterium]|nr:purine-nucleoside phosphorylase [Candidatus Uhrbacteria bacterium]
MTPHIEAQVGEIAELVLFPGDPLRAKRIAEEFLTEVTPYNSVRNMLGFTGMATLPDGRRVRVSAQGSGMGMPSLSIYVNELFDHYGVKTIIRVGTCGSLHDTLHSGELVIAQGACSDSNLNRRRYKGLDFAPLPDPDLFVSAVLAARDSGWKHKVGNVLSADLFYADHAPDEWKMWAESGVLAVDMETAELYTVGARKGRKVLTILTVSDVIPTRESMTSIQRETCYARMVTLDLEAG